MTARHGHRRSIVSEIALPLLLALLPLAAAGLLLIQQRLEARLVERFDSAIQAQLHALSGVTRFEVADPDEGHDAPWVEFDFDPENYPNFDAGKDAEYFRVWVGGVPLAQSRSWPSGASAVPLDAMPEPDSVEFGDLALPDGRPGRLGRLAFLPPFDEDWHEVGARRPVEFARRYPGATRPPALIEIAIDRTPLDDAIADLRLNLVLPVLAMLLVGAALVPWLVRRGLGSLRLLNARLGGIDAGSPDQRVGDEGLPTELLPVASAMNDLLARMDEAFEKERLFSRNVAHELRTPIAELRSIGEVGAAWPEDAEANARFFTLIAESAQRMDRLVGNLLLLAQQERGAVQVIWEVVDLPAAIESALRRHSGEGDRSVAYEGPPRCPILADATLLDSTLNNLIDNMLQYRSDPSGCSIRVGRTDASINMVLSNPASDLTQDDVARLADRFWRKDSARTAGRHAGLGLSLVASLCKALNWRLAFELGPDSVLHLSITGICGGETTT